MFNVVSLSGLELTSSDLGRDRTTRAGSCTEQNKGRRSNSRVTFSVSHTDMADTTATSPAAAPRKSGSKRERSAVVADTTTPDQEPVATDSAEVGAAPRLPRRPAVQDPHVGVITNVEVSMGAIVPEVIRRQLLNGVEGVDAKDIRYRTETGCASITLPRSQFAALKGAIEARRVFGRTLQIVADPATGEGATPDAKVFSALVSASIDSSRPISDKEFAKHLADVPGYVTSWRRKRQSYHVVFVNRDKMFAAKALLDEFEPAPQMRFTVQLSTKDEEAYRDFIHGRGADK